MDQESRDAVSLLVELERAFQSPNIGDQSEAVARFTNLFERYPLPILINSACLKLAEAFRCGSNFIRVQICEVFERNQSHLNKIYNVDDFHRSLFTVTTSNDPIARSITLLTLGNIASIVSGYKSIHHCISSSLESNIECELKATISCAASYVKYSSEFACNIYPKIVSIVDSPKTSTDVKIRSLSVLDHGFYNANDAMTVRSFLIDVIEKTKLKNLICACLTLSTKIAYTSLSHIMKQIELLLQTFQNESSLVIKLNALKNLRFLAENSPHIWESSHVEPLISHLESSLIGKYSDDRCSGAILSIFCKLLTCKCNFISQIEKNRIFQLCYKQALNNDDIPLCSMAFELLTVMSEESSSSTSKISIEYSNSESTMENDMFKAIKSFITKPAQQVINSEHKKCQVQISHVKNSSKPIYKHIVNLCRLNPHYCDELLTLLFNRISDKKIALDDLCPYITELMCAVLQFTLDHSISSENCWKVIKMRSTELSETNLLNLCVLYFQLVRLELDKKVAEELVDKVISNHSLWFGFKVMRQALRYGHHRIAGLICHELHEHVTTDTMDFYFKSLDRVCEAESLLVQNQDFDLNLKKVIHLYEGAVSPLRASTGNFQRTNFQLQFLYLRIRNLQTHNTFRQCCKLYEASPITYTTLLNSIGAIRGSSDLYIAKSSIIQQMLKIAKDFRYLGDCYENLSVVSFNCDNSTLDYINMLKISCIIMADAIDAIFQYGKNLPVISKLPPSVSGKESALEHRELETTCSYLIELIRSEILKPGIFSCNKSIEPLVKLLKTFSNEILKCPFVYPRYFFQPLQATQIKLAITPQPNSPTGAMVLILNYNLVLKVEGLIENLSKTNIVIREVSQVIISVTVSSAKPAESINLFVQSTATPHNNYFKTEFLLPLKWTGNFNVDIDVSIIDERERVWKTGPTERLCYNVS